MERSKRRSSLFQFPDGSVSEPNNSMFKYPEDYKAKLESEKEQWQKVIVKEYQSAEKILHSQKQKKLEGDEERTGFTKEQQAFLDSIPDFLELENRLNLLNDTYELTIRKLQIEQEYRKYLLKGFK